MRRLYLVIVVAALLTLVACDGIEPRENIEPEDDNFNKTGMPIVDEPVTLKFMTGKSSATANDYNDVFIWQEYEKLTNMQIDWGLVQNDGLDYKRTLDIATNEYPEVYYAAKIPDFELFDNGQHGIILELEDLIDQYMPNLKELLETYPEIEKGLTFPDGHIYSLPTIYDPEFTSLMSNIKPFIRKAWLEELDMDIPETTEDFYDYLTAVKETELIGKGEDEEIPIGANDIEHLYHYLKGSFGLGNRGSENKYLDLDPETEKVRFYPATDEYKQLLEYMHRLYSEGLIDDKIYTMDNQKFQTKGMDGLYGSTMTSNPEITFDMADEYVAMPALEGPNGDRSWTYVRSPLAGRDGFAITDKNDNIAATLRWMDYFYSEEGAKLFFMGVEDVTFEVDEEGNYDYLRDAMDDDDLSLDHSFSSYFTYMGSGYPGMIFEQFHNGSASLPSSIEATEKLETDMIEEVWPRFTYDEDETDVLMDSEVDLHKTVEEMRAQLIVGQASFDEWDEYIETLNEIGLEDYLEAQQSAYERYQE